VNNLKIGELPMLDIDRVNQYGHLYFPQYRYHFPPIDFKFQNTGNGTAFLWQFIICILSVEIDPTPVFDFLDFEVDIVDNALQVTATNNGWGTAYDCNFQINEPSLNLLFTASERHYKGTIKSGEKKKIFYLHFQHNKNDMIREQFTNIDYYPIDPKTQLPFKDTIYGIVLRNIKCQWRGRDEKGITHENEVQIWSWTWDYVLTPHGFRKIRGPKSGAGFPSEVTYSTIIDPTRGLYEQVYPLSRKIPPGDIERFHIMIGSPMCCHLHLKFKFLVDKTQIIESEAFDIKIWNPRNSAWHYVYKDGEELHRDLQEQRLQLNSNERSSLELDRIRHLEQKVLDYPFLK
jgi:hypothetical protein